jgi:hypothetical protein
MMRRATSFYSNLFIFGTLGLPGSILYVPYVLIMELVVPVFLSIIGEKSPRLIKKKKEEEKIHLVCAFTCSFSLILDILE